MKQFKGFIAGFIFACLLVVPTTALADNVQAQFNTVNIKVDGKSAVNQGESYQLSDGNLVPFSIIYKGTTYLPVRKVSELLSLNIDYDNASKTVNVVTNKANDTKTQTTNSTTNQTTTNQTTNNQSTTTDKNSTTNTTTNSNTNTTKPTTTQDLKPVSSGYTVINELTKDANTNGDKVQHVIGFIEGKKIDALTSDADTIKNWSEVKWSNTGFSNSILYKLDLASNGVIVSAKQVSANVEPMKVDKAKQRAAVTIGDKTYTIAEDAVIYQVTDDNEYKIFTGNLKDNDTVQLFDTNTSKEGYEIIIFSRP